MILQRLIISDSKVVALIAVNNPRGSEEEALRQMDRK